MKPKIILNVCLLTFVAASVVWLIVQPAPQPAGEPTDAALLPLAGDTVSNDKVIAYYFHGNKRCDTCRSIEAYSKEAFDSGFPEAMASGAIEWRVVNLDEPENDHFVDDFELITRSVVLDRPGAATATSWKNLDQVWDLIGDKDTFVQYVQNETRSFLAAETPE